MARGMFRFGWRSGLWVIAGVLACGAGCKGKDGTKVNLAALLGSYEPDCNDPDAHDFACTEPRRDIIDAAHAIGYPYYIGHAEPTALFFSRAGASGYNMQWKFSLPTTDPAPAQDGSSVANFELMIAHWLGLALCDPNSDPFGACTPLSDTNNPSTAGAAFLELQFYPPGFNLSNTQWSVRLHINTLQDNNAFQIMNCNEPTTQQYLTNDGTPGGTRMLLNNGDSLRVTIRDTPSGLETVVEDLTAGTTGSMIASGANGFVHNSDLTTCATEPFDFHAMYETASPGQVVPWATLGPNVGFDFEIGHWELCGDASCSMLPDGGDADDMGCGTRRGVGGCTASDNDQDGVCYNANWPDGTAAHPTSFILGAPNDQGVGPMSTTTSALTTFDEGYTRIRFKTTESTATTFYPFFTQAGTGPACRFNFGNDIPGTTTNNFGRAAQYNTTIDNPCFPGVRTTRTTYDGQTTQDFHDPALLGATVRDLDNAPVAGVTVDFTLGSQTCSGVTNSAGRATCTIVINQPAGATTVTANFAGDAANRPSSASAAFTITLEEVTLTSTTALLVFAQNGSATLSATLLEDGVTPVAGRSVTITIGSGGGAQSCSGVTNAAGVATCTISPVTLPLGPQPVTDTFVSDGFYQSATNAQQALVFGFLPGGGAFTLGDQTAAAALVSGASVTWWGAEWSRANVQSAGGAPASFKGFADVTTPAPPACGGTFTTRPGNSSAAPAASVIPSYMGVITTAAASKSGNTISGPITGIVVVRTDPGYAPDPGDPGTGTVVATFCP
jgi:hypothetical protein